MHTKLILIILFSLLFNSLVIGQSDIYWDIFFRNQNYYNPSHAVLEDKKLISFSIREQWIGFEGAPFYIYAGYYHPVEKFRSNIGVSYIFDKFGFFSVNTLGFNYAYCLIKKNNFKWSAGIDIDLLRYKLKASWEYPDTAIHIDNEGVEWYYNLNLGTCVKWHEFKIGLSVKRIIEQRLDFDSFSFTLYPTYYFFTAYKFVFKKKLSIEPMFQYAQYYFKSGNYLLAGLMIGYNNLVFTGLSTRLDNFPSMTFFWGFNIKDRFSLFCSVNRTELSLARNYYNLESGFWLRL